MFDFGFFDYDYGAYDYAAEARRMQRQIKNNRRNKVNDFKTTTVTFDKAISDVFSSFFPLNPALSKTSPGKLDIAVPGLTKEDIIIEMSGFTLTVSHSKETEFCKPFKKEWTLTPNSDLESLSAECKNGVLTITWFALANDAAKKKNTIKVK